MQQTEHDERFAGCNRWLTTSESVTVHGETWTGCGSHAPAANGTPVEIVHDRGIAYASRLSAGRSALIVAADARRCRASWTDETTPRAGADLSHCRNDATTEVDAGHGGGVLVKVCAQHFDEITAANAAGEEWTEQRTAKDPERYVARLNARWADLGVSAEIVSVDGVTASGQKRYTVRFRKAGR